MSFSRTYVGFGQRFVARSSPQDFDLSRNKSLRVLEILASHSAREEPGFLTHVLSTITSPAPLEIIIIYWECNLPPVSRNLAWSLGHTSYWPGVTKGALWHSRRFEMLREMRKTRDFRLVLCVDVWGGVGEHAVKAVKQAVAAEKAERGFDGSFPEPLVFYSPRRSHPGPGPDPPPFLSRYNVVHV